MLKILTLNWNGKDKLEKLYPSLINSLKNIDYEWFVKDNNSKDGSIEYLNSFNNNKVKVFAYPNNQQNFSEGCNYIFNKAAPKDNDYIMLLNNDIIFNDTESINKMLSIIKNDDSVGVVGARLLYTNTDLLQHAGVVFVPKYNTPIHFRGREKTDKDSEKNRLFQAVTGAICITKAEYYKNAYTTNKSGISGLNENLNWAFDDIDLCLSVKYNLGKKIVYCGGTNISHEESASLKKNPTNKLFLKHNLTYFLNKWKDRYVIDREIYTKDNKYNLYSGK